MEMGPKKTVIPERTVLLLFFFKLRILSRNRFFSNFYYFFQKLYCFVYFTIGNALKQFSISLLVNMYSTFVNVQKVQEQLFIYFLNYIFLVFFYILLYQFDTNARKYEGYQYNFNQKTWKKILGLLIYNILYSITTSKFTIQYLTDIKFLSVRLNLLALLNIIISMVFPSLFFLTINVCFVFVLFFFLF